MSNLAKNMILSCSKSPRSRSFPGRRKLLTISALFSIIGFLIFPTSPSIGGDFSFAIPTASAASSFSLYTWGYNNNGQLGNGTTTSSPTPVAVTLASGVTPNIIAAGADHSLAIGSDNNLYVWGYNYFGQLGNNTTIDSHTPIKITLASGVTPKAIVAGAYHSLAIGSDNNLYVWGHNNNGQLGNGTTIDSHTPIRITLASGVTPTAVIAGADHSLAIGSDNNLYVWGWNGYGQLGNNTTTDSHTPIKITLASGVTPKAIAGGYAYSLAIGSDNNLYAWGYNYFGQLGNNTTTDSSTPIKITLASGVTPTAIIAGATYSLAVGSDNNLYAWGANGNGQLGNGTTTDSHIPIAVQGLSSGASVAANNDGSFTMLLVQPPVNTTLNLSSNPNPSTYGQSVTFTATVTPSGTSGSVTFKDGSNTLGTASLSGGVATFSINSLNAATHSISAVYAANLFYAGSTSNTVSQVVNIANSTINLTSNSNPSLYSQGVTFTATITPALATGTVTFKDGSSTLGTGTLSNGVASYTTSNLSVATHAISAVYGGDSNDYGSTSNTVSQVVANPSTVVKDCSSYGVSNGLGVAVDTAQIQDGSTITFQCSGDIVIPATINISNHTAIDGSGYNVLLDGNSNLTVFHVTSSGNFTLTNLTVIKGEANVYNNIFGCNAGGGLVNEGNLVITSTSFVSNDANSCYGGAIENAGTISVISNSTFISNTSSVYGGAIDNNGTINTISNSTFANNNGGSNGGAICNGLASGTGTIGTVINSTFYNNAAASAGGAITNYYSPMNVINSTFANNNGGAIESVNLNPNGVTIKNDLFASSSNGTNCIDDNGGGSFTDSGYNFTDDSSCNLGGTGDQTVSTVSLKLGPLQNNGGPTQTILLGAGSAAISQIPSANCPTNDQRSFPRPGLTSAGTKPMCDAGAVETQYNQIYNLGYLSGNNQNVPTGYTFLPFQVTVTDATAEAAAGVVVTFTAPLSGPSGYFTLTTSPLVTSTTATAVTDANGNAISPALVANNIQGSFIVTATVSFSAGDTGPRVVRPHGVGTPVTFNLNNGPNGITNLTASVNSLNFNSTSNQPQSLNLLAAASVTNWQSNISYGAGASGWLTLDKTSGSLLAGNPQSIAVAANPANLEVGTYTAALTFADTNNSANSITVRVSLTVGSAISMYRYYLPFVSNAANGYTSKLTLQNMGNGSATISAQYFDINGKVVEQTSVAGTACSVLATNAACTAPNPFANGAKGIGVLVSNQPLAVLVQEVTPFGSSAYAVSAGASQSLVAPLAINNAGGFNTQLTVANVGSSTTTAIVTYYDQQGNALPSATQTLNLAAHTSQTLDQTAANSNLPSGYYGWAAITGANGAQLVAQVLETRADIKFTALANAQTANASQLFAPAIFKGAFGSFVSGANVVNPNNTSVQITITYYDNTGKAYVAAPFTLEAHAISAIYQGASSGNGIPAGGLPNGFYGSATISSSDGNIVMVVNEAGTQTKAGAAQSGTYAAASEGTNSLGMPIVANSGQGYTTGATILNMSDTAVSGSISYYNPDGSLVAGASQGFSIAAHSSLPVYQGGVGLPSGFYGQAVVTATNGNNSLLVTTNVQSDNLFFSYTEPN